MHDQRFTKPYIRFLLNKQYVGLVNYAIDHYLLDITDNLINILSQLLLIYTIIIE